MELKFTVSAHISKPVEAVFEAVIDPDQLSAYFTTGGAKGRLESGTVVSWDFHDFPSAFPVHVIEVVPNEKIVLEWAAADGSNEGAQQSTAKGAVYMTTITMSFSALEDRRTLVTISEEGWQQTPAGLKASYGNCMGWSQMLCALKVWLEHGLKLRENMYR